MPATLKSILTCGIVFFAFSVFGQDLDEIFDDGDNTANLDILVGTDLVTNLAGTINVYGEVNYLEKVGLQLGVGFLPLGYILDVSNPSEALTGSGDSFNQNVVKGFFFNVGGKYIQTRNSGIFNVYYYLELKRWRFTENPIISITGMETQQIRGVRSKYNFGMGYSILPFDRIGFDAHLGAFLGIYRNEDLVGGGTSANGQVGFDLGLGAFYKF